MAKVIVDKHFNFREGPEIKAYAPSKEAQEVSDACAQHAVHTAKAAHFPPDPKAKAAAPAAAE